MTDLMTSWFQSDVMKSLGWTFIHSLWQIALAGAVLYILLRFIPKRNAQLRYTLSAMTLWTIVVMALSTFIIMLPDQVQKTGLPEGVLVITGPSAPETLSAKLVNWLEWNMPLMLTVWFGGVAILTLRLLFGMTWIWFMRSTAIPEPQLQLQLDAIIRRLALRVKAAAVSSVSTMSPVTIGHIKPLILFPVGIINQLTPGEVEAVLTHELAHIMRQDYLSNLIQSFIETLFYYHPVTWWISRAVRAERENRADDLAVSWCGDRLQYASALVTVQEMAMREGPALSIGFTSRKGAMLRRIQRILNLPDKHHNQMEKTVLFSLCSLGLLAFTLTGRTPDPLTPESQSDNMVVNWTIASGDAMDTIPAKGIYRFHKKTEDEDIRLEVKDGEIRELQIDGREIPAAEYPDFQYMIEDLLSAKDPRPMPPHMLIIPDDFAFHFDHNIDIPPIPDIDMSDFAFDFDIPELDFSELYAFSFDHSALDSLFVLNKDMMVNPFSFYVDTLPEGRGGMRIIVNDGDTIFSKFYRSNSPEWAKRQEMMDNARWHEYSKQFGEQWKEHGEQWKEHAEQWRRHAEQWREMAESRRAQGREMAEQRRQWADEQRRQTDQERRHLRDQEVEREMAQERRLTQREVEMGRAGEPPHRGTGIGRERLSLSDHLVKDGLILPGEEAKVLLTPDKLKINGKKMPDGIHQKYLKLYEKQQGIELSGNSKVEFTTKSK